MVSFVRFLFAFTIGSHILLVSTSISLSILISAAEFISIRRGDRVYEALARKLTKVFVVSFGVGTASGIVMAVELVTLFPTFMTLVAQTGVIILLYSEMFAFFLEILALVLYVYYWDSFRNRYVHWAASIFVIAGTLLSAVLITMVNAWMNTPNGFDSATFISSGFMMVSGVQPWAVFLTPSTVTEVFHVLPTTVLAGSMIIGSFFAYWFLRSRDVGEREMFGKALKILGVIGIVMIVFAGVTGANEIAGLLTAQPLKFASLEANPIPGTNLPEKLFGGIVNGTFVGGIIIPGAQSLLTKLETGITTLPGLSQYPASIWPPLLVHTTFDVMLVGGMTLGAFFFLYLVALLLKRRPYESKFFLYLQIPAAVVAVLVFLVGWATDEIGRQPWIVYDVMRVDQAANLSTSLFVPGILIMLFYILILPASFYFYARIFRQSDRQKEV
ncbi:MAG: cytochrome ubiquinol oxidase subunit I [Nitrososphaerales archaeon]|jgi:cytochrome d ubiquinol oxidase subunit I